MRGDVIEAQAHGPRVLEPDRSLCRPEECDGDRDREREDPDDREGDLRDLTAEAEWLLGHEEHHQDEGDCDEEDLQLPALIAVRAAGADGNGRERPDSCE